VCFGDILSGAFGREAFRRFLQLATRRASRSVLLAFAPSPVVDTQVTNRQRFLLDGFFLNTAENSVVAGVHGQTLENPLSCTPASHVADQSHDLCGAFRLTRIDARDARQTLAEDLAGARRIPTAITADRGPQLHGNTLPWEILQAAEIVTMPRGRAFPAKWAHGRLLEMDHQPKSIGIALNPIQDQNVRARKKRFANGSGETPSLHKAKHLGSNVFYTGLRQICGRAIITPAVTPL
jgi:hypothetical protein